MGETRSCTIVISASSVTAANAIMEQILPFYRQLRRLRISQRTGVDKYLAETVIVGRSEGPIRCLSRMTPLVPWEIKAYQGHHCGISRQLVKVSPPMAKFDFALIKPGVESARYLAGKAVVAD